MGESLRKLKTSNVFSALEYVLDRNRSALVLELMINNLLFVGQLHEEKSADDSHEISCLICYF